MYIKPIACGVVFYSALLGTEVGEIRHGGLEQALTQPAPIQNVKDRLPDNCHGFSFRVAKYSFSKIEHGSEGEPIKFNSPIDELLKKYNIEASRASSNPESKLAQETGWDRVYVIYPPKSSRGSTIKIMEELDKIEDVEQVALLCTGEVL